ncbi:hypothetical protein [Indiicoccus explosivorum]|uniref:hypothetical protein n=1 Tax=Indiicoccus explosivorum TaxID=1917864 RepID=UPI000B4454F1|nr:hypothetical protein [Indiicoccus explosivorum]
MKDRDERRMWEIGEAEREGHDRQEERNRKAERKGKEDKGEVENIGQPDIDNGTSDWTATEKDS